MRVVGIDPGTSSVGYAVLEGVKRDVSFLHAETIVLPARQTAAERLLLLEQALGERLDRDHPDAVAVEKLFFSKNTKTALSVAEARGIILLTARHRVRSIWEYTPLAIKMAVTGYGRADKIQVRRMVQTIFPRAILPKGDDAIDAVAIALTALFIQQSQRSSIRE